MIQIGSNRTEEAGTGEPIGFLIACHGRILDRLRTLERVGEGLEKSPDAALDALRNTLRFFDISSRLHTEDEEVSVFPRLRAVLSSEDARLLDNLEQQHREKEAVYGELQRVAGDLTVSITAERASVFRELASRLAALYRTHIQTEEQILSRVAGRLPQAALDDIRSEMRARRR